MLTPRLEAVAAAFVDAEIAAFLEKRRFDTDASLQRRLIATVRRAVNVELCRAYFESTSPQSHTEGGT